MVRNGIDYRTVETFDYEDLSEEAKEKAFDQWQEKQWEYPCYSIEEAIDSMKAFADHFDVNIKDYRIGGQSDYVSFDTTMDDEISEMNYIRLWKYLKNNNYEKVNKITIYDGCPFTGMCVDDDLLKEIITFLKRPYSISYYDLIDSCFDKLLKWCNAEIEYQSSKECFLEYDSTQNKYLEDGTVYYS